MSIQNLYLLNRRSYIFTIMSYTKSYEISEEIVQDAFVKAIEKFSQYDPKKGKLRGWFTKILFSSLWNYMRAQRKHPIMVDIENVLEKDLMSYEEVPDFQRYLDNTPMNPQHRQVLVAYVILGNTPKEISDVLGVTQDNVRKIVQRFREEERSD